MNIPNKLTLLRIGLSILIVVVLLLPFEALGIVLPKLFVNELIVIDVKYLIAGIIFIVAAITDLLDGYFARKLNCITDYGKMLDAIADKILVNPCLIILAATGFIHPIIPVVLIIRDSFVNSLKMISGNKGKVVGAIKLGKAKTVCLMLGIILTLFYNLPFELMNLKCSDFLLIMATVLSVVSAVQYYNLTKSCFAKNENLINEEDKSL